MYYGLDKLALKHVMLIDVSSFYGNEYYYKKTTTIIRYDIFSQSHDYIYLYPILNWKDNLKKKSETN